MARTDNEVRVTLSVLDRLLDYEPDVSREGIPSRSKNLRQLKQSVRRDLEWLLNTRQTADPLPPELKELNQSLAAYGLPDMSTANIRNPADQTRMLRALETAITTFEPRLQDVNVSFEPGTNGERALRFRIEARLWIEPAPEPITFDTVLQLHSGEYEVKGEN
jgi:type VI secretion system protein ImpF